MTRRVSLSVNEAPIEIDYFVQGFIDHTVAGMVSSLEGIGEINNIEVKVNGNDVTIYANGKSVPLKDFVVGIVKSTVRGMISSLKGVESTEKIYIGIQR